MAKKRAFLKEAARVCGFTQVDVRGERLEEFAARHTPPPAFDAATMRAVGKLDLFVPLAASCLKAGGNVLLWLTREQARALPGFAGGLTWGEPLPIPLSSTAEVWRGTKA